MGLMRSAMRLLFGQGATGAQALGQAVSGVAGAFHPNATRRMELGHDAYLAVHASHAAEFAHIRSGRFDAFVNGLNRLPRPMLAVGTLGLFTYAMVDPPGFSERMQALHAVPEPLWWLLGAVVAFYFGAREAHHLRAHRPLIPPAPTEPPAHGATDASPPPAAAANPALAEWQAARADPAMANREP